MSRRFLCGVAAGLLCGLLAVSSGADELRIAPEDLRLRTFVSTLLSPSLRLQLRELAAGTPLPLEGGVVQTDDILTGVFADRDWDGDRRALVRYYFLVARMEKSRQFSDEFSRRKTVTEEARSLMQVYIADLNRAIARAVFEPDVLVDTGPQIGFPLTSVGWSKDGQTLSVLHTYPAVDTHLGRQTLRTLRDRAGADLELIEGQLSDLDNGEREFLQEVHLVGEELIALRPTVGRLVRPPRVGLPMRP